jgi:hypothetical protein
VRFTKALENVDAFVSHSDVGCDGNGILAMLASPSSSQVIGYVVYASGTDDRGGYSAEKLAFYDAKGNLLNVTEATSGISDNEDVGYDDSKPAIDRAKTNAAFEKIQKLIKFNTKDISISIDASRTVAVKPESLPFSKLISNISSEIERWTMDKTDQGNESTEFLKVLDVDGSTLGYVITSFGSDDADHWFTAGYAIFSADGILLDRKMNANGMSDNCDNDCVVL